MNQSIIYPENADNRVLEVGGLLTDCLSAVKRLQNRLLGINGLLVAARERQITGYRSTFLDDMVVVREVSGGS